VKLELRSPSGEIVSDNFYWLGARSASYRRLNHHAPATLAVTARYVRTGDYNRARVELRNSGATASLATKLALLNADGSRILPAYYSDNYVSLLPGETREIEIEYPAKAANGTPQIAIRGWNLVTRNIPITQTGGS
jgi:hypothetical protein